MARLWSAQTRAGALMTAPAEVAWCSRAQLDERVPGGVFQVFQPVQDYLDSLPGA
jgi:hypothetical protein